MEGHHPYPIALFGKKNNSWRVYVTAREHYILHLLLCKFTPMQMPMFWKEYTSRKFSPARKLKSKSMSGQKHHLYGIGHTEETKRKMKDDPRCRSTEGKIGINNGTEYRFISPDDEIPKGWIRGKLPEADITRLRKSNVDPSKRAVNKGRKFDEKWIENLKKARQASPVLVCPDCGKPCKGAAALGSHRRTHKK